MASKEVLSMFNALFGLNGTRRDSGNKNVISTAYDVFSEKGYANASLSEIAGRAGMTTKNLEALFLSKDKLFKELILDMTDLDKCLKDCDELLEMLVVIIEELKTMVVEEESRTSVFASFLFDSAVPDEVRTEAVERFKTSRFFASLKAAQTQGRITSGDTTEIFVNFLSATFKMMLGFHEGGIAIPENEWFLNVLHYSDEVRVPCNTDIIKQQEAVITGFIGDIDFIMFTDLDTGTMDVFKANGENDTWFIKTAEKGFEEFKIKFCDRFILPEDRDWYLKETSVDNILRKLDADPVLCIDHRIIKKGVPVSYQTKIVLDPNSSRDNKVLIGGKRTYDKTIDAAYSNMTAKENFPKSVVGIE